MRELGELVDPSDTGMTLVRTWAAAATRPIEILPCTSADGERTLLQLQVTTRSPLGAIGFTTGGIFVDSGWIRVLGAGCPRLPRGLVDWNRLDVDGPSEGQRLAGALLIGDDVIGGFFALNGGALTGPKGNVFYLAPDSLQWEDTERGYSDWLNFLFLGDTARFYEGMRWSGWEEEVLALRGDHGISIYPYLWAEGPPVEQRARRSVPIAELWELNAIDLPKQLGLRRP